MKEVHMLDTFDLLLVFDENSESTLGVLNKMLPAAPLMWEWKTLSDTPPGELGGERFTLVRITPESPGSQEAVASNLEHISTMTGSPIMWFRRNVAPVITARQRAIDVFQAYNWGPKKAPDEVIDAIIEAVTEEVQKDITDAVTVHIEGYHHK